MYRGRPSGHSRRATKFAAAFTGERFANSPCILMNARLRQARSAAAGAAAAVSCEDGGLLSGSFPLVQRRSAPVHLPEEKSVWTVHSLFNQGMVFYVIAPSSLRHKLLPLPGNDKIKFIINSYSRTGTRNADIRNDRPASKGIEYKRFGRTPDTGWEKGKAGAFVQELRACFF